MLGIYVRTSIDDEKKESPIEQQKKIGIEFAVKNNYQYEVFEDKGISGFKIANDDNDPFKNRPRFTDLINDIKEKKVDKVWVWEHSRLSRNQYASAIIFNLFEKQNIKLFENDKEFNLKDPQTKMFRGILDIMAEYERSLIIGRTTRGQHNRINQGKRSFGALYGYKYADDNSRTLVKVESEQENLEYSYRRILEGATLRQLTLELYNNNLIDKSKSLKVSRYWHKILRHFSYTGYELKMNGLEIVKKFDNFEIDDLSILNDEQYYIKSKIYSEQIISIEDWIRTAQKLRVNRDSRNKKINKASTDLATGIITCSECGEKYYSFSHTCKKYGKEYFYQYYKHYIRMQHILKCSQKKSFIVDGIDNIFYSFFFYYYMVFDNTKELLHESQRLIKVNLIKQKEQIARYEKNEKQYEKQIQKFTSVLDETEDSSEIKILARRINEIEEKIRTNFEDLAKAKIEFEQLNSQYSGTEAANTFYNVVTRVRDFFDNNIEEQRNSLMTIIKKCLIFSHYLLIDTGTVIFVFDTSAKYKFNRSILENLDKKEVYKKHFIESFTEKMIIDISELYNENYTKNKIYEIGEIKITEVKLTGHFNRMIVEQLFGQMDIRYDASNNSNVLFFMDFD